MADMGQLERAFLAADKAGDTQAAQVLAAEIMRQRAQAAPQQPAQPPQGDATGMLDAFTQGAAFGFGDELTGTEAAILGRTPEGGWFDYSRPYDERYQRAVDAERAQQAAYRKANPVKAAAAEIGGALAVPMAAAKTGLTLMGPGMSLGRTVGMGALEGAGYGAAQAAGDADGGDRLAAAAGGAAVGGATGGLANAAIGQISRILANRGAAAASPTWQGVRAQADAAYKRARAINPAFADFDQWVMSAYRGMPDAGYHPNLHPQLATVMNRIEELSRAGTAPKLKELEQLRRLMGTPASTFGNPDQQRLARALRNSLDDFMANAAPRVPGNQVVPAGTTVVRTPQEEALAAVREGRELYRRSKNGERLARMAEMAEDRAGSTYSGANAENAIRQNFRKILDNDKLRATFTPEEVEAIRLVVRGEPLQNVMRKLGSMSPLRGGLMSLMMGGGSGVGFAASGFNPLALAPAATFATADALARAGTRSQARAAEGLILGGPGAAGRNLNIPYDPRVAAIINALAGQAGGATSGGR